MLGIENDETPLPFEIGDGLGDHAQIFFKRCLQSTRNLGIPGFTDNSDNRSAAGKQIRQPHILISCNVFATRRSKGRDACVLER